MARAGMTGWRGRHAAEGGDDVQKSLELLDQVLSEFDDLENGNVGAAPGATVVDADSPSLGHQSEDDGYMSMNGRRAKFLLDLPPAPEPAGGLPQDIPDFPPPPEEAERLIANLLPRVTSPNAGSPSHGRTRGKPLMSAASLGHDSLMNGDAKATATQTTLPKTRYQRPYGWRDGHGRSSEPSQLQGQFKFGSLPYEGMGNSRFPSQWINRSGPLPPRTLAAAGDKHREVRRQRLADGVCCTPPPPPDDESNFSDDSLDGSERGLVVESAQKAQVMVVDAGMTTPDRPAVHNHHSVATSPLSRSNDVLLSPGHRGSIAWEVPLDDSLLAPGSTKVVGRRRRHSNERSSNGSLHRSKDGDDWPEPPSGEDESASALSDQDTALPSALPLDLSFNGTYIIRKGRKRERAPVHRSTRPSPPRQSTSLDARTSATFDNIRQFYKENRIEELNGPPPEFSSPIPPALVRVLSLPTLPSEEMDFGDLPEPPNCRGDRSSKSGERFAQELATTVEEAEDELSSLDNPSLNYVNLLPLCLEKPLPKPPPDSEDASSDKEDEIPIQGPKNKAVEVETQTDLSDLETQTELELVGKQIREISKTKSELEEVEKKIQEIVKIKTTLEREKESELAGDPWVRAADLPPPEFPVQVEVHEFGPLPPSPVDEFDTYSELFHPGSQPMRRKADTLPDPFYRCDMGSDPGGHYLNRPPEPPPHRQDAGSLKSRPPEPMSNSLKTRSMDAGFARGPKANGSRRESAGERRTLPCELPGPASRRRTLQKRTSTSPQDPQTSCSLPETPIFARGCDIPRTPARSSAGPGSTTGSYRPSPGVPLAGVEMLRLAGGPARGWYPRHRHPRPASSEHLDRLPMPAAWDTARKPMTLPPNMAPKFFHRSPRDALRRVTSLLIRGKGSSSKDGKKEVSTTLPMGEHSETVRQKRGFFRSLWKRSRHYSLDQQ